MLYLDYLKMFPPFQYLFISFLFLVSFLIHYIQDLFISYFFLVYLTTNTNKRSHFFTTFFSLKKQFTRQYKHKKDFYNLFCADSAFVKKLNKSSNPFKVVRRRMSFRSP